MRGILISFHQCCPWSWLSLQVNDELRKAKTAKKKEKNTPQFSTSIHCCKMYHNLRIKERKWCGEVVKEQHNGSCSLIVNYCVPNKEEEWGGGRRKEKGEEGGLGGCVVLALGGLWDWFGFRTLAVWGLDSDVTATWSCGLVGTGIRWL